MGTFMRMNTAYALVKTVSVKMIGFKTLKELTRRAQMREQQARIRIKIMNWLIVVLCLVIIFVGITGCVGFNG
jgi:flagellar biosynthesis/type III secretory pathway M-ring protein FliF/YscJ